MPGCRASTCRSRLAGWTVIGLMTGAATMALCRQSADAGDASVTRLFDGKTLDGWQVDKSSRGKVGAKKGAIYLIKQKGKATRVEWTGDFPRTNYELSLEVIWLDGWNDFCRVTFPVGDTHSMFAMNKAALALLVGRGASAYNNTSKRNAVFKRGTWYEVRVRVTDERVQVWVSGKEAINEARKGYQFGVEGNRPFALGTWDTEGAYRSIVLQLLGSAQ